MFGRAVIITGLGRLNSGGNTCRSDPGKAVPVLVMQLSFYKTIFTKTFMILIMSTW